MPLKESSGNLYNMPVTDLLSRAGGKFKSSAQKFYENHPAFCDSIAGFIPVYSDCLFLREVINDRYLFDSKALKVGAASLPIAKNIITGALLLSGTGWGWPGIVFGYGMSAAPQAAFINDHNSRKRQNQI